METKNPLLKYKEDNNITWRDISIQIGMTEMNVIKISQKNSIKELYGINLGTYLILKNKLKVDLLKF